MERLERLVFRRTRNFLFTADRKMRQWVIAECVGQYRRGSQLICRTGLIEAWSRPPKNWQEICRGEEMRF
jgi:hypothetical protein